MKRLAYAGVLVFTAWTAILPILCGPGSPVSVRIRDGQSGNPIPARVVLAKGETLILPEGFPFYDKKGEKHFLVPADFEMDLAPGDYTMRVERGKEYHPAEEQFTVRSDDRKELRIKLDRWIDMRSRGWYSADLHIHRPPEAMADILRVEDLNVAPVINAHYWRNWDSLAAPQKSDKPVVKVDEEHAYGLDVYEIERIVEGPGAVMLYGSDLTIHFQGYELYPPSIELTRQVHRQGGYVDGDKPFWLDTPVNVALGEIDFIEIACNHFFPRGVDADIARWAAWQPEPGFGGDKGFALWIMQLYYRFLNSGFELAVSGGSASGVKPLPVGYDRVYVKLDQFSYEDFFSALKQGRSFSTNGPMLELEVNGNPIGSRIAVDRDSRIRIQAKAEAAGELENLEIVINGKVVATEPGEGSRTLSLTREVEASQSMWVAARAFEKSAQTVKFAHTSPIYAYVDHKPVRIRDDLQYLLDKVDDLIERTRKLEGFREEAHRERTLEVYRRARQVYLDRLEGSDE